MSELLNEIIRGATANDCQGEIEEVYYEERNHMQKERTTLCR